MQEQNPYETPKADLGRGNDEDDHELAGRGSRLGAYLIDSVILIIVSVPLLFAIGYIEYLEQGVQPPATMIIGLAAVVFLLWVAIHGYFLYTYGQTVGKRMVGIKITDLHGDLPNFGTLVGLRFLTIRIIKQIPIIGAVFGIVNVLFIFRADRRCIHDHIARTKVLVV